MNAGFKQVCVIRYLFKSPILCSTMMRSLATTLFSAFCSSLNSPPLGFLCGCTNYSICTSCRTPKRPSPVAPPKMKVSFSGLSAIRYSIRRACIETYAVSKIYNNSRNRHSSMPVVARHSRSFSE